MRICIVTEGFMLGGPATVLAELIGSWPVSGDEFTIVATRHSEPYRHLFTSRLNRPVQWVRAPTLDRGSLHRLAQKIRHPLRSEASVDVDQGNLGRAIVPRRWHWLGRLAIFLTQYPLFVWNVISLTMLFRRLRPNFLLVSNGGYPGGDVCRAAVVASGRCRVSVVALLVHTLAEKAPIWRWLPERLIDRYLDRHARIICVSQTSLSRLREVRAFRQSGVVIPNGFTLTLKSQVSRQDILTEFDFPTESYVITIVASYDPQKGHHVLFEAVATLLDRFPNIRVLAFGAGSQSDSLRLGQLVREFQLNGKAVICGFRQNVTAYVGATDLLVLPTLAFESLPMVIIEAMGLRVPVIASDVGGVGDLVVDGVNGRLISPGDPQVLAEAIEQAIHDPEMTQRLVEQANEQYRNAHTGKAMARSYHQLVADRE